MSLLRADLKARYQLSIPQTTGEWMRSLWDPVLVVGNGPIRSSALKRVEKWKGSIVRLNNFELCPAAGFRVTHWVCNGYKDVQERPLPCGFSPWTENAPPARCVKQFKARCSKRLLFAESNNHVFEFFPEAQTDFRLWPSTGFSFVSWLWSMQKPVFVTGFNGLVGGHYWDPAHKHTHQRTGGFELNLIQQRCTVL